VPAANAIQEYEARTAALEGLIGKQTLELEFLKGPCEARASEPRAFIRVRRPRDMSVAEGCRLTGIARSTCYDPPARAADDTALVEAIAAICGEFEAYGSARARPDWHQQAIAANYMKVRRPMRKHDLHPKH
jgi:hypothetical protein